MSITRYFKQAWGSLARQPLLSVTSVAGAALAIFLIMVIYMIDNVKVAPFPPESARDRWLVQAYATLANSNWGEATLERSSNGPLGYQTIRKTFGEMETPEAIAVYGISADSHLSVAGKAPFGAKRLDTDHGFWKVMDFTFIEGHPYDEADVHSGLQVAVVSESLARKLFDTTDCVGREFSVDHVPYKVCGVVKDVSNLVTYSYANFWVPLTSNGSDKETWNTHMGPFHAIVLAKSKSDFPAIRKEYDEVWKKFGEEIKEDGWVFFSRGRPYDQVTAVHTPWADNDPDMESVRRHDLLVYGILLLIPAINLSSMTQSRLRRRCEEIGVRRAFGATRLSIMREIFCESLIITVCAGILGFILSISFIFLGGKNVLAEGADVTGLTLGMVFNMSTFLIALLFCFLLNLLSAIIPSWQASRTRIVNALTGHNK